MDILCGGSDGLRFRALGVVRGRAGRAPHSSARVWAAIPGTGYVGMGEVIAPAVAIRDFEVEVDGVTVPILQAPLEASNMGEDADDPEQSEYLARVRWIDARPREQAVWEKGMFANQNVVAKLRQPFTLQRLAEVFRAPTDSNPE